MNMPKVSVIIPAYRGAEYLGKAIQSVLNQTYADFELIIVNDASPDNTDEVIREFNDQRIKYIVHEKNAGVNRARTTGVMASTGEIIAFLDQDDFIHPEKLRIHVSLFERHPEVGFTYNARFELNYSAETIRDIWRPPTDISLADLVLGFPIAPSDAMLRREWAFRLNPQNHDLSWTGGEIAVFGGLLLDGCKFASVNRALNYRRHRSGRIFRDLAGGCASEIHCQDIIFDDPRCPEDVLALRHVAHANIYIFWAYRAFAQNETELGREFLQKAVQWNPSILDGNPCELVNSLVVACSDDENVDHADLLKRIFAQLPPEMSRIVDQLDWATARGCLLKGARGIMWDRPEDGHRYFEDAVRLNAVVDESYLDQLIQHVLDYELEFGNAAARNILKAWSPCLRRLGGRTAERRLHSLYAVNRAFEFFHAGNFDHVPRMVLASVFNDPRHLSNRGIWAILVRSVLNGLQRQKTVSIQEKDAQ